MTCKQCASNCMMCTNLTTCAKCADLYELSSTSTCRLTCKTNEFYNDTDKKCVACDTTCATCNNSAATNCMSCNTGLFLTPTSTCAA